MRLATKFIAVIAMGLATACQEAPSTKPANTGATGTTGGSTLQDHAVAGQTLRCELDGVAARITFSRGGRLNGRFLQASIGGKWTPVAPDTFSIAAEVPSGPVNDTLRQSGGRWVGSAVTCA